MRETHVPSLGWIDPLEKGMATHSSILPWRSPWMEEPDGLKSMGLQRVGHHGVIRNKCKKSKLYGTRPRVQFLSGIQLFETPWTAVYKDFLSITNSQRLLKPMSTALVMPSNHSSSVHPFCLQSVTASGYFFFLSVSQFFTSGGQSIGAEASASVLPINIQGSFPLGLTDLISLQSKGLSGVFSNTTVQKHQFFGTQLPLWSQFSHPCMPTGKTIALTRPMFVGKVMSLLLNMLSRLKLSFSSKEQASFNFMAAVTICSDFGAQENSLSLFPCLPQLFAMK